MHSRRIARSFGLALLLIGARTKPAFSQDAQIIGTPAGSNSPFAITKCAFNSAGTFPSVNIFNRTKHELLTARMALRYYDKENALIGQAQADLPVTTPVDADDAAVFTSFNFYVQLSEPTSAIAKIECKPFAATFSGNRHWNHGSTWPEKLLPLASDSASAMPADTITRTNASGTGRMPPVALAVTNAWNDVIQNVLFVHDTVALTGGTTQTTLRPSNFILSMTLANGTKQAIQGLAHQSMSYQKFDSTTHQFVLAPEVDPKDDLGNLGAVVVPAGRTVSTTVTFLVQDAVSQPNDNRSISIRY